MAIKDKETADRRSSVPAAFFGAAFVSYRGGPMELSFTIGEKTVGERLDYHALRRDGCVAIVLDRENMAMSELDAWEVAFSRDCNVLIGANSSQPHCIMVISQTMIEFLTPEYFIARAMLYNHDDMIDHHVILQSQAGAPSAFEFRGYQFQFWLI